MKDSISMSLIKLVMSTMIGSEIYINLLQFKQNVHNIFG